MAIVTHPANDAYRSNFEETFGKKEPRQPQSSYLPGVPRRRRMDLMTPAELACLKAISEIEGAGCDHRLTAAQMLIEQAQNLVADYVDSRP